MDVPRQDYRRAVGLNIHINAIRSLEHLHSDEMGYEDGEAEGKAEARHDIVRQLRSGYAAPAVNRVFLALRAAGGTAQMTHGAEHRRLRDTAGWCRATNVEEASRSNSGPGISRRRRGVLPRLLERMQLGAAVAAEVRIQA